MVDQSPKIQGPAQTVKFWRINRLKDIEILPKDKQKIMKFTTHQAREAQVLGLAGFWQ